MNTAIGILVLFLVTKHAACDDGGNITSAVSNETISSNTDKSLFDKIADFFKGAFKAGKKSDSPLKEGNSTLVPTTQNSSTYNTTEDQSGNRSIGITAATGTIKPPDATSNSTTASEKEGESNRTTSKENSTIRSSGDSVVSESALETNTLHESAASHEAGENAPNPNTTDDSASNEKEDELNKTKSKEIEESTADESFTERDTRGHSVRVSEPVEEDLHTEEVDASNPNTTEDESLGDEDSTLPEEAKSAALEDHADNGTGKVSEFELKPENREEYCIVYVNKLVGTTLTEHKDQLDPLTLRDIKLAFEAPVFISSVKGQAGFYDGKVIGLTQGNPTDECRVEEMGDQVRLKSGMYIEEAFIKYKGRVTLLDFGPKITVNTRLSGINTDLTIVVPKSGGIGKLESLRVGKIKRMQIDVEGLGVIDWAAEFMTEEMTKVFTLVFRRSMEKELRKALEDEITKIQYT